MRTCRKPWLANYSSTSTSFTNIDGTNLPYTVTIPTGWKLLVDASANIYNSTSVVGCSLAISDGGTPVVQTIIAAALTTLGPQTSLTTAITGDGSSQTITLQYSTANASDAVNALNNTGACLR